LNEFANTYELAMVVSGPGQDPDQGIVRAVFVSKGQEHGGTAKPIHVALPSYVGHRHAHRRLLMGGIYPQKVAGKGF
jgi:hypothetical protein